MDIILLQTDIAWQNPEKNRRHIERVINTLSQTDMIILPEMFTTGFCTFPKGVAEESNSETLIWMQKIAKEKNVAIGGSVATVDNGQYFNRFYFVKPNGTFTTYDKKHLFSYADEDKEYTAGVNRVIVEYKEVKILLQICYDLRFPVFSRNRGDYDMIIYIASWPTSRIDAWKTLMRARAIENQCYVAAVNRVGSDPGNTYNGATALIDYFGRTVAEAKDSEEDTIQGCIDLKALNSFRHSFPALQDADKYTLI